MGAVTDLNFSRGGDLIIERYLRMRVMINVHSNLLPGCFQIKDDSSLSLLRFKYECLTDICFKCSSFLHKDVCNEIQKSFLFDNNIRTPALGSCTKANLNREALVLPILRNKNIIRDFPLDFQSIKLTTLKPPQSP